MTASPDASGPTTYPRASRIQFTHDPREDRLRLDLVMARAGESAARTTDTTAEDVRRAWLTRRVVNGALERLSAVIGQSHPAVERSPEPDEVLQMEHVAAVAGQGRSGSSGNPVGSARQPSGPAHEAGAGYGEDDHLITGVQIETDDAQVKVGLWGTPLTGTGEDGPVAALNLTRPQAHQLLRLLQAGAARASWDLQRPAPWMGPIRMPGQQN